MNCSTKPNRYDLFVAAAVVLLAILLALPSFRTAKSVRNGGLVVTVSIGGETVETMRLLDYSGEHTYTNNGCTLTVCGADGTVDVTEADCPGKDCQHAAPISRSGQCIVCLPGQIVISLSAARADYDLIAG